MADPTVGQEGATPLTHAETRVPRTVQIDVKAMVESLDPTRHEPTVEYEFTRGRVFKRKPYE